MPSRVTRQSTLNTSDHSKLDKIIAKQIAETPQQRIAFAEFMDLALYHAQSGYYATRALNIGTRGDFFTAPHLASDFGELLAEQCVQLWQAMQCPTPFTLVEMGAGQGLLAADMLRHLRQNFSEFCQDLEYIIVERAVPLIAEQQRQLRSLIEQGLKIRWQNWDEIPSDSIIGCCFSNELVDAFPVHQVVLKSGKWQEVYVAIDDESVDLSQDSTQITATHPTPSDPKLSPSPKLRFREVLGPLSTPRLAEYLDQTGIDFSSPAYPDGYRTEVNLAALDWLSTIADRIHQGFLLTIDYGHTSDRYYHPTRHQGTLQCYYHHAHHSDPYQHVGDQDITAHVDFTALQRWGDRHQLTTLGFTQQGLFLLSLGLGDRIAALSQEPAPTPEAVHAILRRREALHQLVNPLGLGNFGVLIQSKGFTTPPPVKGLTLPPLPG